ncbi:MAG: WxcM-like domain-containing protein, partial [Chitinophagaceae bacterium]|nr:WxcM-like domain-containing protein [Rubrivivax sp.]
LGRGVRIGPNAVFVDPEPGAASRTVVKEGACIGANAVVHAGVTVAARAVVRPGAVVTCSVPPGAIVEGHPAVIVGYVGALPSPAAAPVAAAAVPGVLTTDVKGVAIHQLPLVHDLRGDLIAGEFNRQIPFAPQRFFMVLGVPGREVRSEHAHRQSHHFMVCVHGSCSVVADDGRHKVEVLLDAPQRGIHLPPMVWGIRYRYSADAVLLVFASHHEDAADCIRDYDEYLALVRRPATADALPKATPRTRALHV